MHVGDLLVERLVDHGLDCAFGSPGGQTLPFYNAVATRPDAFRHILVRDERSGVFAADAYARLTGRIGVCDATVGPGASNLVSGLAEAFCASIPVLAIVSDIPRHWEHRRLRGSASQGFEQRRFLEPTVKWYGRVEVAETLLDMVDSAIRIATSGRPGPVVIEIPDDVFAGDVVACDRAVLRESARFPRQRFAPAPSDVHRAAGRVADARRPIVVAGGGAVYAGAGSVIRELVELLGCPIVTTLSGKGVVSEDHPLCLGVAGRFGMPMANDALAQSDVVIFVGSKTGQTTTSNWTNPSLDVPAVQIDVDPSEIGRDYRDTVGLVADAHLGVAALTEALRSCRPESSWDREELGRKRSAWWNGPIDYLDPVAPGLKPQDVVCRMRARFADADVIVTDASLSSGWMGSRYQLRAPGRALTPRGLAGLGWGLPAAIGAAAAIDDDRRVLCLVGDGGWAYSMGEVETAARMGMGIVSIVLNNSTLAWIKHAASNRYGDGMVSQDFSNVSYALGAQALGARAERVVDLEALDRALDTAANNDGVPTVIEVMTSEVETPVLATRTTGVRTAY